MINVMQNVQHEFEKSGLSLTELGVKMGYSSNDGQACKAAWQFLHRTVDPKVSSLDRFARAVGVPVTRLIDPSKLRKRPKARRGRKRKAAR